MHPLLKDKILVKTGASEIRKVESVQSLWSGFGAIERLYLKGAKTKSVIIKRIQPPTKMNHPRGWNSDVSAKRKMQSYQIERSWYQNYAPALPQGIKIPNLLFQMEIEGIIYLVQEDLMESGFVHSFNANSDDHFDAMLHWLARFHAYHLNSSTNGLWPIGSYWHLDTRKEEFERMKPGMLKDQAHDLDRRLNECKFKTIVHGDAKPANFCFSQNGRAAAVDFQYVGGGCGIKDVVYLMSSALSEEALFQKDQSILDRYFFYLERSIHEFDVKGLNFSELKSEWQGLYDVAWCDFLRFLEGWLPDSKRINFYTKERLKQLL